VSGIRHTGTVDAELSAALKSADPVQLGRRIRTARVAKGLTQGDLAGTEASIAFVSRIEAGLRRPDPRLLDAIASRLGVSPEELVTGVTRDVAAQLRLELDYAELALATGDPESARGRASGVLEATDTAGLTAGLARQARYLHARALEALGEIDQAILRLEKLTAEPADDLVWVRAAIALCRCYRESGDLTRAIATGERARELLAGAELEESTEFIQLVVTMASAYFEQGDVGHSIRLCLECIEQAERLRLPEALAAAYWNASTFQSKSGSLPAAIDLAGKALSLLEQGQDARNLARLRSQLGVFQLRADPPQIEAAEANLQKAAEELAWSSASTIDLDRNALALARAYFLKGDHDKAAEMAVGIATRTSDTAPLLAAEALALSGQVAIRRNDIPAATTAFNEAILTLSACGADRNAAQLWFDLGALLDQVGHRDAAHDAYLRAAASTGLSTRVTTQHIDSLKG